MFIAIDTAGAATLAEADNFRSFSIRMAQSAAALATLATLARLARPDGPAHAWIAPERVRALVPQAGADWLAQFTAMTEYAAGKGWTDASGSLRAHIE